MWPKHFRTVIIIIIIIIIIVMKTSNITLRQNLSKSILTN